MVLATRCLVHAWFAPFRAKLESRLKVPNQYRFPFFQELMWYAAMHYGQRLQRQLADEKYGQPAKVVAT